MLSIIIPACNEERILGRTLRILDSQPFKDFEVIVACNGCSDRTEQIAKWFRAKVIVEKESNVSRARNLGAKAANGSILVFLDADTEVSKDTLGKIAATGYTFGTCKVMPDNSKRIARVFMKIKNIFSSLMFITNGILFCSKNAFELSGGFDESKTKRENHDFMRRAKKFGSYGVIDSYVKTSMRRFEKWGYFNVFFFWAGELFRTSKREYEKVR